MSNDKKILIIGAGVSGLVAAYNIEKAGYRPIVFDQKDKVGGRVQTDFIDGIAYDKGFQILLPNYPAVKKYLDLSLLDLKYFSPGAFVFRKNYEGKIGNPTKDFDLLFSTLFSKLATISDKLKIIKLFRSLKYKTFKDIFTSKSISTITYLKEFGFSDTIIDNFFKPFYAGIFLEEELETSSRMFEFTFKLFSESKAAIPEKGIQVIPNQLAKRLQNTSFHFNTKVDKVEEHFITLSDGKRVDYDAIIIATEPSNLITNLSNQHQVWNSVDNIYFQVKNRVINLPMIGLVAEPDSLINNFHYLSLASEASQILSVSIVKSHSFQREELITHVSEELKEICGIEVVQFLKHYKIDKALPKLMDINYKMPPTETKIKDSIFLAGDVLSNGSLNAAMLNGESAAEAVLKYLSGIHLDVG